MDGVILINKPSGWTSHDVVAKVRGILGEKQVGHLGTLDPLATGVLPLAVGAATRLIEFASFDKQYGATCLLGRTTDSCDITGKTLFQKPVEGIGPEQIRREVERLKEIREQVPPMVSAVKTGGQKLYELARKGVEVERKPRPVEIKEIEVKAIEAPRAVFRVVCSAGTYVRVLCQTVGDALGVGGCLESLQRTRVGPFTLEASIGLEELQKKVEAGNLSDILLPSSRLVDHLPRVQLEGKDLEAFCHGREVRTKGTQAAMVAVWNPRGRLCAIGEAVSHNEIRPRKVFGPEGLP